MTLRSTTYILLCIVFTYSCKNSSSNNNVKDTVAKTVTSSTTTGGMDADTSSKTGPKSNNDSVVLNTEFYQVTTKPNKDEPGEHIAVYNKATKQSFAITGDNYFVDLKSHYILTEAGTAANYRSFSVYDLTSLQIVFSGQYETDLNLQKNRVSFKTAVTLTDPALKPKCSPEQQIPLDNLGYIEQQYFNLTTKKLQKTGQYECWYFE